MVDLKLENDEGIIQQADSVECIKQMMFMRKYMKCI